MSRRQDDDWDAQPITNKQKQQVEAAVKLTVEKYGGTLKLLEEDEQPIKQPDTKDKTLLTETDLRKQLEETPIHYLKAVSEPNFYLSSESINWIVALIKIIYIALGSRSTSGKQWRTCMSKDLWQDETG